MLEKGLAPSRHQAQGLILSGRVLVNDEPVDKPGTQVPLESVLRIKGGQQRFVGRGGEKLAGAIDHFEVSVQGLCAIDVGSSTGGFTDCLLQGGARRVYAVDVGYNQLAHSLRTDERVLVFERTHAKNLCSEMFPEAPDFLTIDVSFISVCKILPFVLSVCAEQFSGLILVKPQFELEAAQVSSGGVVRSKALAESAVFKVKEALETLGCQVHGWVPSQLQGYKKGNQEYFLHLSRERLG